MGLSSLTGDLKVTSENKKKKNDKNGREFLFRPRQFLGKPAVVAPQKTGFASAAVQFIIPGLSVGKENREAILYMLKHLGLEIHGADLQRVENKTNKRVALLVAVSFYVQSSSKQETVDAFIDDYAITIVERFLGMLTFYSGIRHTAVHTQVTIAKTDGSFSNRLEPAGRSGEQKITLSLPKEPFADKIPTDTIFIALFWLRRGLAERDPLDTYAAFMVCLQAIAREVVGTKPSLTSMVRELVVDTLGASPELFEKIWKVRNTVVAHGNRPVDAGTFLLLTELKMDAAKLCYKGIKLAMNLPLDGPPHIDQSFFVTSHLMYVE